MRVIRAFPPALLTAPSLQAAEDALAYIQNRHHDLVRLQASIKELHGLFVDMALLVAKQGELIDQIEYNVSTVGGLI